MLRVILITHLFFFFYFTNGFSQTLSNDKNLFNEESLLRHIKILSSDLYEGRRTGTKGGVKARKYIMNQFYFSFPDG